MKKLSDYKGDEALELWADLLEPMSGIFTNEEIKKAILAKKPKLELVKEIIKSCKKEAIEILTRIDPTPVDGFNIIVRLLAIVSEIETDDNVKGFFGYAEQAMTEKESSGSVTENTEDAEK